MKTHLTEIFSSIQGEGPYVGERHLFVRFSGCHRACIFCDTDFSRKEHALIERVAGSNQLDPVENPITVEALRDLIREMDINGHHHRIALTGGAPLLQAPYLKELLPLLRAEGRSIYLETAGDLPKQLESIIEWVDVVAMDVKLPSVTHDVNSFPAHWQFLEICRKASVDVFTKMVVSAETDEAELLEAIEGIRTAGGEETLIVLQPMTPAAKIDKVPNGAQLLRWQQLALEKMPHVRVIPQTHKMIEVL